MLGYEIHMGQTEPVGEGRAVFRIERRLDEPVSISDGWATPDFRIWGSYIHGLFDRDAFSAGLVSRFTRETWFGRWTRQGLYF